MRQGRSNTGDSLSRRHSKQRRDEASHGRNLYDPSSDAVSFFHGADDDSVQGRYEPPARSLHKDGLIGSMFKGQGRSGEAFPLGQVASGGNLETEDPVLVVEPDVPRTLAPLQVESTNPRNQ